jgi:hypothetical protein
MLKTKNTYNVSDVVALKLTNGQDLVGKLLSEQPDSYTVSKPLILAAQQGRSPNDISIGFVPVPLLLGAGDLPTVDLLKRNVVAVAKACDEVIDAWTANTSSILQPQTANSGLVVPGQ